MIKRWIMLWKLRNNPDFHPKLGIKIKYAFELDGVKYFQLDQLLEMPIERFNFLQQFYHEMNLRITTESLHQFLDAAKECIQKVQLGDAMRIVEELKDRSSWFAEEETTLRFASVQYFTLDEDLTGYNMAYNEKKIEGWRKKKAFTLFLEMWSKEQGNPLGTSSKDLEDYLEKQRELAKSQNSYIGKVMGKKP